MRLIGNNVEIHWQGEELANERLLEELRQKRHKKTVLLNMVPHVELIDRALLLRLIFHELVPFVIISKEDEDKLVFEAFLEIFPYTINGQGGFQAFSLRLVPRHGSVEKIYHELYPSAAINNRSLTEEKLVSDIGNGSLHFECYLKKPTSELLEMVPPEEYEKEVVFDVNDYLD